MFSVARLRSQTSTSFICSKREQALSLKIENIQQSCIVRYIKRYQKDTFWSAVSIIKSTTPNYMLTQIVHKESYVRLLYQYFLRIHFILFTNNFFKRGERHRIIKADLDMVCRPYYLVIQLKEAVPVPGWLSYRTAGLSTSSYEHLKIATYITLFTLM